MNSIRHVLEVLFDTSIIVALIALVGTVLTVWLPHYLERRNGKEDSE
jgi:hypothetical protein